MKRVARSWRQYRFMAASRVDKCSIATPLLAKGSMACTGSSRASSPVACGESPICRQRSGPRSLWSQRLPAVTLKQQERHALLTLLKIAPQTLIHAHKLHRLAQSLVTRPPGGYPETRDRGLQWDLLLATLGRAREGARCRARHWGRNATRLSWRGERDCLLCGLSLPCSNLHA